MPPDDQELRLRELEKTTAAFNEVMKGIQSTLSDIKSQISGFLDKAQLALAIEGRTERLEDEVAELFKKSDAAFKLIDSHKTEFSRLQAEHEMCAKRKPDPTSWLKERTGRVVDASIIGLIVWLLTLYKTH